MATDVTRDSEGLCMALGEMLERGLAQSRVTRTLDDAGDEGAERIFGTLSPLSLASGYYKRAEYLLWLEKCKESGLAEGGFTVDEAEGLIAVAEARRSFERNHPPCGICGALQDSQFSTSCHKCGTEFVRRGV